MIINSIISAILNNCLYYCNICSRNDRVRPMFLLSISVYYMMVKRRTSAGMKIPCARCGGQKLVTSFKLHRKNGAAFVGFLRVCYVCKFMREYQQR